MSVKLYGTTGSPNVRGAMLGLMEKGVDYQLVEVAPPFKDPEHLSRNPFGRVPVLDHNSFVLYETQAILRYIDQAFEGASLQPVQAQDMARMNQILGIIDCYLFNAWSGTIAFERLVAPKFMGRPSDLGSIAAATPMARTCAEVLEDLFAGPFLTGATFSLADIRLMPHFHWFGLTSEGETILAGKPKLAGWFEQVRGRASAEAILTWG